MDNTKIFFVLSLYVAFLNDKDRLDIKCRSMDNQKKYRNKKEEYERHTWKLN